MLDAAQPAFAPDATIAAGCIDARLERVARVKRQPLSRTKTPLFGSLAHSQKRVMSDLFDSQEEIQKDEFLKKWRESEHGNDQDRHHGLMWCHR
jgi:hypothetical protein